jgi:hypothetical protein
MAMTGREKRRSSRGQNFSETTPEDPPRDGRNPNLVASNKRDIVVDSGNVYGRGPGSVENSSVELTPKTSSVQASDGKLPDGKPIPAGKSTIPIESTTRKHFTRNKKAKVPEKDEMKDEQRNLVSLDLFRRVYIDAHSHEFGLCNIIFNPALR